jgi:hypothetical protein
MTCLLYIGNSNPRRFASLWEAELHGMEAQDQNCAIVHEDGRILSFKRREHEGFTRITKQEQHT